MPSKNHLRLFLVFALLLSLPVVAQVTEHSITVQGVGEIVIDNSQAHVNASVTSNHVDANQALLNNNMIISNMISELNGVGISGDDISTSQFHFQPDYRWENNSHVFIGYTVTNGLNITVDEVASVGSILNLLVDAGATRINSVRFGSADLSAIKQQALVKAIADARLKAEIIAQASGVTLGQVIQVNQSSSAYMPPTSQHDVSEVSMASVPISPGSNTVREQVSVSYLILD